jgi:hypothetical protein
VNIHSVVTRPVLAREIRKSPIYDKSDLGRKLGRSSVVRTPNLQRRPGWLMRRDTNCVPGSVPPGGRRHAQNSAYQSQAELLTTWPRPRQRGRQRTRPVFPVLALSLFSI